MSERVIRNTVLIVASQILLAGVYFGFGRAHGHIEMKVWQDKWYAEQREEHVIRGMAFVGDCRIIPPTGDPTTQYYQENTFTFQPGPCFIGNVPMKVTWNNIPWYQSQPPKPPKASKPAFDWFHYYVRGYKAALFDQEQMRKYERDCSAEDMQSRPSVCSTPTLNVN